MQKLRIAACLGIVWAAIAMGSTAHARATLNFVLTATVQSAGVPITSTLTSYGVTKVKITNKEILMYLVAYYPEAGTLGANLAFIPNTGQIQIRDEAGSVLTTVSSTRLKITFLSPAIVQATSDTGTWITDYKKRWEQAHCTMDIDANDYFALEGFSSSKLYDTPISIDTWNYKMQLTGLGKVGGTDAFFSGRVFSTGSEPS